MQSKAYCVPSKKQEPCAGNHSFIALPASSPLPFLLFLLSRRSPALRLSTGATSPAERAQKSATYPLSPLPCRHQLIPMIRSLSHSPSTSPHPSSGDALPVAGPSTVIAPVDQPSVDPSEEGKKREGAAGEVGETSGKEQRQLYSTGEAVKGVSAVAESRQEDIQVTPGPREQGALFPLFLLFFLPLAF